MSKSADVGARMEQSREALTATIRRHRGGFLATVDAAILSFAYAGMALLRYEQGGVPWRDLVLVLTAAVVVHLALCWQTKLYRGRAVVGSTEETVLLVAVTVMTALIVSIFNIVTTHQFIARTVPFGAGFTASAGMVLIRALWRSHVRSSSWQRADEAARTLVIGAGDAGRQLVRSMLGTTDSPYLPIGFLDDDPWKRHLRADGVPVRGTVADLEAVVESTSPDVVVVAVATATSDLISSLTERCAALGIDIKVLPPVEDLFEGRVSIRDVRDINVVDLLGRNAVETDIESIAHVLNGKRVLVTGAGGSIGSELARQIHRWHPAELMMLDHDESNLHGAELSIHGRALLDSPEVILCDIRDQEALSRVFEERRPEVVFHAAALKHLPMLEQYPVEAIKTNVLGTVNVLEAAQRVAVERFVNISTDKAAEPTSVLGFSKRAAERLTADFASRDNGTYLSVRFGNVLGSRGSVLTTFAAQIAQGGPVTVTHPDVTRYFMTVGESVQLVLQAAAIGSDGEVLILDMGDPVRIDDVARELIRQSGRKIDIVYTGLREGEKLDEILRADGELEVRPHHPLIAHVTVPQLPVDDVRAAPTRLDATRGRALLQTWCDVAPTSSLIHL